MGIWLQNSFILSFAQKFQARGIRWSRTKHTKHRDTIPLTEVVSWSQLKSPHDWLTFYMDISAGTAGCWIFYLKTQKSSCSADVLWLRLSSCSTFPWAQMTTFGMMAIYPIFCEQFCSGNLTSISELLPFSSLFSGVLLLDYVYCWLMFVTSILSLSLCIYVCICI